jgi:HD-GYP domain-containing protein (c-di-GMP phosphodiesterase class II)
MKVLLIENQIYLTEYYKILLEQILDRPDVVEVNTLELAKKSITSMKYDLIVCDLHLEDHPERESFLSFLEAKIDKTPFVLVAADRVLLWERFFAFKATHDCVRFIKKPFHRSDFFKLVRDLVPSSQIKIIQDYLAIKTMLFFKYDQVLCDVFVKIGKEKYILLFKKGADYSTADIERYINRSIDYLYVKWADYNRFISESGERLSLFKLRATEPMEIWKRESATLNALIKSYGVNETVFVQSIRSVVLAIKEINSCGLENTLFRRLQKQNYSYDHSYLVAMISAMITQRLKDLSERQSVYVGLAAFLHDLSLDSDIAHVPTDTSSDYETLTPYQKKNFLQHPYKMAYLLKQRNLFNTEVERIIIEHHEREDGSGFPRGLVASQMHYLSIVFIVAHDFVEELYLSNFDSNKKEEALHNLYRRYQSDRFKKVILALLEVFEYPVWKLTA